VNVEVRIGSLWDMAVVFLMSGQSRAMACLVSMVCLVSTVYLVSMACPASAARLDREGREACQAYSETAASVATEGRDSTASLGVATTFLVEGPLPFGGHAWKRYPKISAFASRPFNHRLS